MLHAKRRSVRLADLVVHIQQPRNQARLARARSTQHDELELFLHLLWWFRICFLGTRAKRHLEAVARTESVGDHHLHVTAIGTGDQQRLPRFDAVRHRDVHHLPVLALVLLSYRGGLVGRRGGGLLLLAPVLVVFGGLRLRRRELVHGHLKRIPRAQTLRHNHLDVLPIGGRHEKCLARLDAVRHSDIHHTAARSPVLLSLRGLLLLLATSANVHLEGVARADTLRDDDLDVLPIGTADDQRLPRLDALRALYRHESHPALTGPAG